jgi:ABC-type multidrug transport system ATPase subunit
VRSLQGLRKSFGAVTALDGVSFDAPRGRILEAFAAVLQRR